MLRQAQHERGLIIFFFSVRIELVEMSERILVMQMKNISKTVALDVSHLTVAYNNTPILSDVSVTIPQGVMCGIIGPNGAGKTTFIKAILNLIPVVTGNVQILGSSIKNVRNKIAYVQQRSSVDWDFPITVFDMVLMGCYGKLGWFKRPGDLEHMHVYEALAA